MRLDLISPLTLADSPILSGNAFNPTFRSHSSSTGTTASASRFSFTFSSHPSPGMLDLVFVRFEVLNAKGNPKAAMEEGKGDAVGAYTIGVGALMPGAYATRRCAGLAPTHRLTRQATAISPSTTQWATSTSTRPSSSARRSSVPASPARRSVGQRPPPPSGALFSIPLIFRTAHIPPYRLYPSCPSISTSSSNMFAFVRSSFCADKVLRSSADRRLLMGILLGYPKRSADLFYPSSARPA